MLPLAEFGSFIQQHALFDKKDRILLAISGGRDSVLLAHLLQASGYTFTLAHANFQLRGDESDGDEAFCVELAAQLKVQIYINHFDTQAFADDHQLSIQMAARHLRYEWLERIRQEQGFACIALAHHQNDSTETVLLNLVRGTGVSGLHGILPKRGYLVRPLLAFTREEIDAVMEEANLPYREDSSNASAKYARNKIRLEVIPVLKELNPSLEQTFEANRRRMLELEDLLQQKVAACRQQLFSEQGPDLFEIDLLGLQALHPLRTLLFELFRPYGFTEAMLENLIQSWAGQPGKLFYSGSHQLLLDRGVLRLSPLKTIENTEVLLAEGQELVVWGNQKFSISRLNREDFVLDQHPAKAQVDAGKLQFPLKLRSWHQGDVFQPLGLHGQKKLSDLFIEHKIPLNQKHNIAVLENGNGDIVWVAGIRLDERYKVSENTKKVLIFEQFTDHV